MTFQEVMLPASDNRSFSVRLYYNKVSPCKRPSIRHSHPTFEFSFFREGSGVFSTKDKQYPIEPGDVFLFRGNEQHYVTEIGGDKEIICPGLQFSPDFIWSPRNEIMSIKHMKLFTQDNKLFHNQIERGSETVIRVRELLLAIENEFKQGRSQYSLMIKVYLISILVLLIRYYSERGANGVEENFNIKRENMLLIDNVMRYIDSHITEDLDIKTLAGIANMSVSYFSRLFKALNGFTTWDYIVSRRIHLAQNLLLSTENTVLDIAMCCGFHNSANFNRAFRKITGESPSEYRKN